MEAIYLTPLYHLHPLHRHVDISQAIVAESSEADLELVKLVVMTNVFFINTKFYYRQHKIEVKRLICGN